MYLKAPKRGNRVILSGERESEREREIEREREEFQY
jgi:hypothetical protein